MTATPDDLPLLVNATVTELAILLARLATETGHPEIAKKVAVELDRMAERADLEMALLEKPEETL